MIGLLASDPTLSLRIQSSLPACQVEARGGGSPHRNWSSSGHLAFGTCQVVGGGPLVPHTINTARSPSDSVDAEHQTGGDSGHISLCCTRRWSLARVAHAFDGFINASNSGAARTTAINRVLGQCHPVDSRCVGSGQAPRPMDPCGLGEA